MHHAGIMQAGGDLLPIFGSGSVTSDVINGKRDFSKAHIRRLADFHVSPEVFLMNAAPRRRVAYSCAQWDVAAFGRRGTESATECLVVL